MNGGLMVLMVLMTVSSGVIDAGRLDWTDHHLAEQR